MTPESLQMLLALALGFAVAGLCSSAYQLATSRLPSFGLLSRRPEPVDLRGGAAADGGGAVPDHAQHAARRASRKAAAFEFVFLATLIAGFWSLMSGLVLVMTLQACGLA